MDTESDDGRLEALEVLLRGTVPTFQHDTPQTKERQEIKEEPIGKLKRCICVKG